MPNELDQFLKDIEQNEKSIGILEEPLIPEKETVPSLEPEDKNIGNLEPSNRRERRLLRQLEQEREAARFMAGKLEAITETQKATGEDPFEAIDRLYGTDTPEGRAATELLKGVLKNVQSTAEERAYNRFLEDREQSVQAVAEEENYLDEMLDDVQDTFNVNFTPEQESQYFQLMERMSPKDRNGNIVEYADPYAVYEVFAERSQRTMSNNRAKDLSNRSMVQGTASDVPTNNGTDAATIELLRQIL